MCHVYKKQKTWQKPKTGLEKANKQRFCLQDTNTLTHFRTINTLQYAEYMMGWARRLPENQCYKHARNQLSRWRKQESQSQIISVILRQMVMKEEALAKTLNKPLMKHCWCWTWEKLGLVKLAKSTKAKKLASQENKGMWPGKTNPKVKFVHHRGPE